MAKERLFPEQPKSSEDDTRKPHERFSDLAVKVVTVPKSEIDAREKKWQARKRPKR